MGVTLSSFPLPQDTQKSELLICVKALGNGTFYCLHPWKIVISVQILSASSNESKYSWLVTSMFWNVARCTHRGTGGRRGWLYVKVLKSPIVQENCSKVLLKVFCRAQSSRSAKLTNGLTAVLQSSRVRSNSTRLLPDKDTKKASLVKWSRLKYTTYLTGFPYKILFTSSSSFGGRCFSKQLSRLVNSAAMLN